MFQGRTLDVCRFCRTWKTRLSRAVSIAPYSGNWREAILHFKTYPYGDLARQMAHALVRLTKQRLPWSSITGIVPVPARQNTENHPAHRLAELFSNLNTYPIRPVLRFIKKTQPQRGLKRKERLSNLKYSMRASIPLKGETLLLIDDVMTTGATLHECARALNAAGAEKIYAATLAQGVWE
jgi:ComF family protein